MNKWNELKKDLKQDTENCKRLGGSKERIKHNERVLRLMDVIEREERGEYGR